MATLYVVTILFFLFMTFTAVIVPFVIYNRLDRERDAKAGLPSRNTAAH